MNLWKLLEYASWIGSALILAWMLLDAIRVGREYDEEFLLSSQEGVDEIVAELLKAEEDKKK
jgi:hypothetical protein